MQITIGKKLELYKGIGPGFDFLRIGLASVIVLTHCMLLTKNGPFLRSTFLWFVEYAAVPMFFALSGFLVAGSAMRLSLKNFLINRGLRIAPALAVDVVVCALIIGPLVTSLPLTQYLTGKTFFTYFLNVTGWIHYYLPGVFEKNPFPQVNGALWTVPYEILCYLVMSFLMVSRGIRTPKFVGTFAILFFVTGCIVQQFAGQLPGTILNILNLGFVSRGSQLIFAFLLGILSYQLKDRIPYDFRVLAACLIICVGGIFFLHSDSIDKVPNRLFLIPCLTYITVYLGITNIPIPKIFHTGDYSYGIYLYHNPFLQIIILTIPSIVLLPKIGALVLFIIGMPIVGIVAALSWHLIEKPILGLRKRFSFVANVRGVIPATSHEPKTLNSAEVQPGTNAIKLERKSEAGE